jgi:hypothetical protein
MLTHHHREAPPQNETVTLVDWVLYQKNKFKLDPDNFDSHPLCLLKGIKFSFVKEDNNKASFYANLEAYIHFKDCRNTITIPEDHILHKWRKHWRFQGKIFFEGLTNKVEHHPARILKCFGRGVYSRFPIEMTNGVPIKLLATVVTSDNYYCQPPADKFLLKNILAENNKNCSQPKVVKSFP